MVPVDPEKMSLISTAVKMQDRLRTPPSANAAGDCRRLSCADIRKQKALWDREPLSEPFSLFVPNFLTFYELF